MNDDSIINSESLDRLFNDDAVATEYDESLEIPKLPSRIMKLEEGKNMIRILSRLRVFYRYFKIVKDETGADRNTPFYTRTKDELPADVKARAKDPAQYGWIAIVWNYNLKLIQTLEITQVTIMRAMEVYMKTEDYGKDYSKYDFIITKEKGNKTTFSVIAGIPKDIPEHVKEEYNAIKDKADINNIFHGKKTFAKLYEE